MAFSALLTFCVLASGFYWYSDPLKGTHIIAIKNVNELHDFFKYTRDRIPFISSHRGGPKKGLPENSIPTFENTLQHTWSLLEIDPHYTKDSAIVLMHDATLDRTSTGHGKVSDYTLEEIRKLKLKDTEGNVTDEGIPTLDEVLEWAKGRTILMLDQKDVSTDARVKKIKEHHAELNAMVMAYSPGDAKRCYELDKNIMMELVFMGDMKAAETFDKSGVPWRNVVVFVTHTEPRDKAIFDYVHSKGAMCIWGSSRTIDKDYTDGKITGTDQLNEKYRHLINQGADIIEADLGVEAGAGIESLQDMKSPKGKYFKIAR
jgi:glycerophosphoryl diester phosphodiesterase